MDETKRDRSKEYEAQYHLKKLIGLQNEMKKNIEALGHLGIVLDEASNFLCVRSGIENCGITLEGTDKYKYFEMCGYNIWQEN